MIDLIKKLSSKQRIATSDFTKDCISLISERFDNLGYHLTTSSSKLKEWRATSEPYILLNDYEATNKNIPLISAVYSPSTPLFGIDGILVKSNEKIIILDSFEWECYLIIDKNIKILKGLLLYTLYGAMSQPLPGNNFDVPVAIIPNEYIDILKEYIDKNEAAACKLYVPTEELGIRDIYSLIATHPIKKNPSPLVCAHIDSIHGSFGAHDNASGIAVVLELAQYCIKYNLICNFAIFNGEESNKVGSINYVEGLSLDINQLFNFVLEVDSVGIGRQITLLCSKKIRKKLRDADLTLNLSGEFEISISPQTRICFSDVWPFMKKGVSVTRMLSKDTKDKIDQRVMHTLKDTIDNIDINTLQAALTVSVNILQSGCYE